MKLLLLSLFTPILGSFLFYAGGREQWSWCILNQKLWRKLMGIPIGILWVLVLWNWIPLISIGTYLIPYLFPYGVTSWITNRWLRWSTFGLFFGLASIPVLGYLGLLQGLVASISFTFLMFLSNIGISGWKLTQTRVELYFGLLGLILYILKIWI